MAFTAMALEIPVDIHIYLDIYLLVLLLFLSGLLQNVGSHERLGLVALRLYTIGGLGSCGGPTRGGRLSTSL